MKKTVESIGQAALEKLQAMMKADADLKKVYSDRADEIESELTIKEQAMKDSFRDPDKYQQLFREVSELSTDLAGVNEVIASLEPDPVKYSTEAQTILSEAFSEAENALRPSINEFNSAKNKLKAMYDDIIAQKNNIREWSSTITNTYTKGSKPFFSHDIEAIDSVKNRKFFYEQ